VIEQQSARAILHESRLDGRFGWHGRCNGLTSIYSFPPKAGSSPWLIAHVASTNKRWGLSDPEELRVASVIRNHAEKHGFDEPNFQFPIAKHRNASPVEVLELVCEDVKIRCKVILQRLAK
jgi:hypothetical protein